MHNSGYARWICRKQNLQAYLSRVFFTDIKQNNAKRYTELDNNAKGKWDLSSGQNYVFAFFKKKFWWLPRS
jgi:hypothetical protein